MSQILLIEDDENDFEVFRRYLNTFDQSTKLEWIKTISESKTALESHHYEMIFIDLDLPDSRSSESIKKIIDLVGSTPIIILTGNEDEDLLGRASHSGIYDTLLKSDLNAGLLKRIIRYTKSRYQERVKQEDMENLLLQSQRVETIGRLTGGIAHDFNNKLAIISCTLEILKKEIGATPKSEKYIKMMSAAIKSSTELTKHLLAFGRSQELEKANMDLKLILKSSLNMLERVIRSNIKISTDISEDELFSFVDIKQIDQLILNLVLNAQDAIGGQNGEIKISVSSSGPEAGFSSGKNKNQKFVKITVSDSGCGIDEITKSKTTEPFSSTKELLEGADLGLSVVDGIVNQHNGFLIIKDNRPKGLSTNIYLPQVITSAEITVSSDKKVNNSIEDLVVLYAEDDAALRELTKTVMEKEGLKVIEAIDGKDAIQKFEENKSIINVILTDVVMPKMSGKELFLKVRELEPGIGVIFLSGYSQKELTAEKGRLEENCLFLRKPCDIEDLLDSLLSMYQTYGSLKKHA